MFPQKQKKRVINVINQIYFLYKKRVICTVHTIAFF